jgi:hypothetical protein
LHVEYLIKSFKSFRILRVLILNIMLFVASMILILSQSLQPDDLYVHQTSNKKGKLFWMSQSIHIASRTITFKDTIMSSAHSNIMKLLNIIFVNVVHQLYLLIEIITFVILYYKNSKRIWIIAIPKKIKYVINNNKDQCQSDKLIKMMYISNNSLKRLYYKFVKKNNKLKNNFKKQMFKYNSLKKYTKILWENKTRNLNIKMNKK